MAKVLMSVGPIPAKLDSVKYITNRFKGGLAVKTAEALKNMGHEVTLVAWRYSDIKTNLPTILVDDVYDYFEKILSTNSDAYILAAAVANIGPAEPFKGKFPSHNYKVGDKFDIKFTIMPRIIDEIKNKYPKSTLVGYKLFDGTQEELVAAAQKTLFESRANLIFANHPSWAKERKIVITADGAVFDVSFNEHVELTDQLLRSKYYRTEIIGHGPKTLSNDAKFIVENYPKSKTNSLTFGTFAVRMGNGFVTTTRGKKDGEKQVAFVEDVDHSKKVVYADRKATLNAPLLHKLLSLNPQINYLIHDHKLVGDMAQCNYQFPGTDGDLKNAIKTGSKEFMIQLPYHGYIAGFTDIDDCKKFINKHGKLA